MSIQIVTKAIVLSRTNFGEADRILNVLTPDHGKLRLMAKGVRKERSKLAGGIELFSVSSITYITGRKEIGTLISTRLIKHHEKIVQAMTKTMLGYELLKRLNKAIEDAAGEEYFHLMEHTFAALNEPTMDEALIEAWFNAQLLKLGGHHPNLKSDKNGSSLSSDQAYGFEIEDMTFFQERNGPYRAKHIKLLRLLFGLANPLPLQKIEDIKTILPGSQRLVAAMLESFVRI